MGRSFRDDFGDKASAAADSSVRRELQRLFAGTICLSTLQKIAFQGFTAGVRSAEEFYFAANTRK